MVSLQIRLRIDGTRLAGAVYPKIYDKRDAQKLPANQDDVVLQKIFTGDSKTLCVALSGLKAAVLPDIKGLN